MSKTKHRAAFEDFMDRSEERFGELIDKVILYGSVAKGLESKESDVDMLIVVKDESIRNKVENLAFDIGLEHGIAMSPIVKTLEEFKEVKDTIYGREVRETGEVFA